MNTRTREKSRIPEFATIQEAAEFFDRHDLAEFEDELEEVEIEAARPLGHLLTVRMDAALISELARAARDRATVLDDLIVRWLKERLAQEAPAEAPRPKSRRTSSTAAQTHAKPASKAKR